MSDIAFLEQNWFVCLLLIVLLGLLAALNIWLVRRRPVRANDPRYVSPRVLRDDDY